MKDETRKQLSALILEELSEKIKTRETLGQKLEAFTDLPVEKVAEAILKQFEYLLSSELRELIIHLIEQEISAEKAAEEPAPPPPEPPRAHEKKQPEKPLPVEPEPIEDEEESVVEMESSMIEPPPSTESIMEHFGTREPFPSEAMDITLDPQDWFYVYGFSYAPISSGKGVPVRKLRMKGVDGNNNIFLLDYGDVRLYLNKLTKSDYTLDKTGKPTLSSQKGIPYKYEHEKILNILRGEEVMVPLPFWTIMQGRERIASLIEDRYVELLRALIDVHDAVDWDIEVFAFDEHIVLMPEIAEGAKERTGRESRHATGKTRDIKVLDKLTFKEKSLAQEIHSNLLLIASKAKIDYMIRLDNAFMDDWKSILLARYIVGKERRKSFCQEVVNLQQEYSKYQLMIRMTNPTSRFSFLPQ